MEKKTEPKDASTLLTFVSYYDGAYSYEGVGVLTNETKDVFHITSIIGAVLTCEQTSYSLHELPAYIMSQQDSDYIVRDAIPIPAWVRSFPVDGMTPTDIHHCGLFFEHFLLDKQPLVERLERIIQSSLLTDKHLATVIRHILTHYRNKGEEALLACAVSPVIQSALHAGKEKSGKGA